MTTQEPKDATHPVLAMSLELAQAREELAQQRTRAEAAEAELRELRSAVRVEREER